MAETACASVLVPMPVTGLEAEVSLYTGKSAAPPENKDKLPAGSYLNNFRYGIRGEVGFKKHHVFHHL